MRTCSRTDNVRMTPDDIAAPREGELRFDRLASALANFELPAENLAIVRDHVDTLGSVRFLIPPSRPYIAVISTTTGKHVAHLHPGFIDTCDGAWITLPMNWLRDSDGRRRAEQTERICHVCKLALPASGICDYCT